MSEGAAGGEDTGQGSLDIGVTDGGSGDGGQGAAQQSWRDGLSEDLKANPSLTKFEDVPSLAKGYVEAQSLIGKKGIIPPGENATPEEMSTFYNSLGRPDSVDGYELDSFKPPDVIADFWDRDGMQEVAGILHEAGLTKAQASTVIEKYAEHQANTLGQPIQQIRESKANAEKALKQEWGAAYNGKMDQAKQALHQVAEHFGMTPDEVLGSFLPDGQMVGNSVFLTKLFAEIGDNNAELKFLGGKERRHTMTPEEATDEVAKLEASEAYTDARHPEHRAVIQKLDALYQQMYPGEEG
jgi:hypothetical protein